MAKIRRQELYKNRQKDRGFTLIEVWVPSDEVEKFKAKVATARAKHLKNQAKRGQHE